MAAVDNIASEISINEHSSIHIQDRYNLWIDPYMVHKDWHDGDIILITHAHYDHFSAHDISKVVKPGAIFIAPESMRTDMYRVSTNVTFMKPGDEIDQLGIHIQAVSAYNKTKEFHPKSNNWLGYVITLDKTRVYVSGDMDKCDEAKEGFCDIALVSVGGGYTLDAKQAAKFVAKIKPKYAIPTHYGTVVGEKTCGEEFSKFLAEEQKSLPARERTKCELKLF